MTPNQLDPRNEIPNPMASGLLRTVPLAAVILSFATVAIYWGDIPAGYEPTRWMLWAMPFINLLVFIGLEAMATIKNYDYWNYPVKITEENKLRQHTLGLRIVAETRLGTCLLLAYSTYQTVLDALGRPDVYGAWVTGALVVALLGMITYRIIQAMRMA